MEGISGSKGLENHYWLLDRWEVMNNIFWPIVFSDFALWTAFLTFYWLVKSDFWVSSILSFYFLLNSYLKASTTILVKGKQTYLLVRMHEQTQILQLALDVLPKPLFSFHLVKSKFSSLAVQLSQDQPMNHIIWFLTSEFDSHVHAGMLQNYLKDY